MGSVTASSNFLTDKSEPASMGGSLSCVVSMLVGACLLDWNYDSIRRYIPPPSEVLGSIHQLLFLLLFLVVGTAKHPLATSLVFCCVIQVTTSAVVGSGL